MIDLKFLSACLRRARAPLSKIPRLPSRRVIAVLALAMVLPAFEGVGLAADWLIVHKDGVQTVYVDRASVKRTAAGKSAWVKGALDSAAVAGGGKRLAGYESYYHFDCRARKYRVTETTFYYADRSSDTTRMAGAPWKSGIGRVYFLYEYLCDQLK